MLAQVPLSEKMKRAHANCVYFAGWRRLKNEISLLMMRVLFAVSCTIDFHYDGDARAFLYKLLDDDDDDDSLSVGAVNNSRRLTYRVVTNTT